MMNGLTIIEALDTQAIQPTLQKIAQFQAVVQQTLKPEQDFGVIPGTNKPTLLKPGAEKIGMLFGLSPEYEIIDRVEDFGKPFISYSFRCTLHKNGVPGAQGVGCCNSLEPKYKYTWVKEHEIPVGVDKSTLKTDTDRYGKTKYRIENPEVAGLANTIMKMAKKRAYIDATLQVAALSEVFTQDLEDMKEYLQNETTENMTPEEAAAIKIQYGKHKGKTLGEVYKTAYDWIVWYKDKADKKDPVMLKAIEILEDAAKQHKEKKEKQNDSSSAGFVGDDDIDYSGTPFEDK